MKCFWLTFLFTCDKCYCRLKNMFFTSRKLQNNGIGFLSRSRSLPRGDLFHVLKLVLLVKLYVLTLTVGMLESQSITWSSLYSQNCQINTSLIWGNLQLVKTTTWVSKSLLAWFCYNSSLFWLIWSLFLMICLFTFHFISSLSPHSKHIFELFVMLVPEPQLDAYVVCRSKKYLGALQLDDG